MKLKKVKIIGTIVIFLFCFPLHFLYDFSPNFLTSIISPINESIWEHMKLIYTSYLIWGIVEYFLLKNNKNINNFFIQLFLVPIFGICIYLIIYLPIYNLFGENLIVSILLLFIIIALEQIFSYFFLKSEEIKNDKIIGIIGSLLVYIIFGYFTYFPLDNYLFWDINECVRNLKFL